MRTHTHLFSSFLFPTACSHLRRKSWRGTSTRSPQESREPSLWFSVPWAPTRCSRSPRSTGTSGRCAHMADPRILSHISSRRTCTTWLTPAPWPWWPSPRSPRGRETFAELSSSRAYSSSPGRATPSPSWSRGSRTTTPHHLGAFVSSEDGWLSHLLSK